jgi:hypothetical protein
MASATNGTSSRKSALTIAKQVVSVVVLTFMMKILNESQIRVEPSM